jgi:hypothetical protein
MLPITAAAEDGFADGRYQLQNAGVDEVAAAVRCMVVSCHAVDWFLVPA